MIHHIIVIFPALFVLEDLVTSCNPHEHLLRLLFLLWLDKLVRMPFESKLTVGSGDLTLL